MQPKHTSPKTVRFWEWENGGWVRLSLRDGQEIQTYASWYTDEGWSSTGVTWSRDGDTVYREIFHDGVDCDGRLSSGRTQLCSIDQLKSVRGYGDHPQPWVPSWVDESSGQRDYSAEAMGY